LKNTSADIDEFVGKGVYRQVRGQTLPEGGGGEFVGKGITNSEEGWNEH